VVFKLHDVISQKTVRAIVAAEGGGEEQQQDNSLHSSIAVIYRSADKSLARLTSRCTLFNGENISFDSSLVLYIYSINIPPIIIINRIYENQNLLFL
jgi:hypothetical protein